MFFEARQPVTRDWGKKRLFRGHELSITSDQIFHLMFHVGTLQPMHSAMICVFLGVAEMDVLGDLPRLGTIRVPQPDARGPAQLAQFLETLAFAAGRDLEVSISA
jgi:hypothetical protein